MKNKSIYLCWFVFSVFISCSSEQVDLLPLDSFPSLSYTGTLHSDSRIFGISYMPEQSFQMDTNLKIDVSNATYPGGGIIRGSITSADIEIKNEI